MHAGLRGIVAVLAMLAAACSSDDPEGLPVPADALRFTELSAGYFHTCGLAVGGKTYCWGGNAFGTLGDGTRTTRTLPSAVATTNLFTSLDAGAGHNCALTSAGAAHCWGHNDEGQLGDGTFTGRDAPVAVSTSQSFTAISAGHAHSCALTTAGAAYCWGDDTRGQLGNGDSEGATRSPVPVRVQTAVPFSRIHAGYYQSCALAANGDAYCWGAGESGQNGDGTVTDRHAPVRVNGNRVFTSIAAGDRFVCAVSAVATWCWGANRAGELARPADGGSSVPVEITGNASVTGVFAASGASTIGSAEPYACAIRTSERAVCWGGAVRALRARGASPTTLDDRIRAGAIAPGAEHVCVLDRDAHAFCGGANYEGQLGDGTRTDRSQLVAVPGPEE